MITAKPLQYLTSAEAHALANYYQRKKIVWLFSFHLPNHVQMPLVDRMLIVFQALESRKSGEYDLQRPSHSETEETLEGFSCL